MKAYTPREILKLPMRENDSGESNIRGYLLKLLKVLWQEKEGFSGKRPFGNSDWDAELAIALIDAEAIDGALDEDGYIDRCDQDAVDRIVGKAIDEIWEQS